MKTFPQYLKSRAKIIVVYLVVVAIFVTTDMLFDMPQIAILYPLILTLAMGIVVCGFDFLFFSKKHIR